MVPFRPMDVGPEGLLGSGTPILVLGKPSEIGRLNRMVRWPVVDAVFPSFFLSSFVISVLSFVASSAVSGTSSSSRVPCVAGKSRRCREQGGKPTVQHPSAGCQPYLCSSVRSRQSGTGGQREEGSFQVDSSCSESLTMRPAKQRPKAKGPPLRPRSMRRAWWTLGHARSPVG